MFKFNLAASAATLLVATSPALARAAAPWDPGAGAPALSLGLGLVGALAAGVLACAVVAAVVTPRLATALGVGQRATSVLTVLAGFCLALLVLPSVPALAQAVTAPPSDTTLILPWGQWVASLAQVAWEILKPVILAAAAVLARNLPWYAQMWFTTQRIDRMVDLAGAYALNAVNGATEGKALSVDVGYTVLRVALERAMGSSPRWLIDAAGGEKGITERLFRVFKFDESVTDANTLTPLLRDLGAIPAR